MCDETMNKQHFKLKDSERQWDEIRLDKIITYFMDKIIKYFMDLKMGNYTVTALKKINKIKSE